ncbi:MAG: Tat pathway signal protein [Pseudomonadota bacterium]
MPTRKEFIYAAAAASLGGVPLLQACSGSAADESYTSAVQRIWYPAPTGGSLISDSLALRRELVRFATLAPSSHNTQCWKFHIEDGAIQVLPDLLRRCPAVDPDDHHLFVSLGCAIENIAQAALAHGLQAEAVLDNSTRQVQVKLAATRAVGSELFKAIPERQCTRGEFDGQGLSLAELRLLEQAGTGRGVRVMLLTDKAAMEKILEYVTAGNTAQLKDTAFVAELKHWIRFSSKEAVQTGDGLYTGATGNPSVPRWLGSALFAMFLTPKGENDKYSQQIRSSAGIAVFVSETNNHAHWLETGRCYQRFALQATALGIRNAMLNQPVEVASLRPQFASHLGIGKVSRPDLVLRFGRGPKMPQSLRRPLQAVLV